MKGPRLQEFGTCLIPHNKISSLTNNENDRAMWKPIRGKEETRRERSMHGRAHGPHGMAFASPSSWHLSQKSLLVLHATAWGKMVKKPARACTARLMTRSMTVDRGARQTDPVLITRKETQNLFLVSFLPCHMDGKKAATAVAASSCSVLLRQQRQGKWPNQSHAG